MFNATLTELQLYFSVNKFYILDNYTIFRNVWFN